MRIVEFASPLDVRSLLLDTVAGSRCAERPRWPVGLQASQQLVLAQVSTAAEASTGKQLDVRAVAGERHVLMSLRMPS